MLDNKENLVEQKERINKYCMNLECQNEQLNVLIKKLHSMSCEREDKLNCISSPFSRDIHNMYIQNSSVLCELQSATEEKSKVESIISGLKAKMKLIDEKLRG